MHIPDMVLAVEKRIH